MFRSLLCALYLLVPAIANSQEDQFNISAFLNTCREDSGDIYGSGCLGFIKGIVEGITWASALDKHPRLCLPPGTSVATLRKFLVNKFSDRPAGWSEDAGPTVAIVLIGNFPCKNGK